jgi:hypothetical protein
MSNMKVVIKECNPANCSAVVRIESAILSYFADPTKLTEASGGFKPRYDGTFHIDKDAEGVKELVDMMLDFQKRQSSSTKQAFLSLKDGDELLADKKGKPIKGNANTWIIPAYRHPTQEPGKLISKKAYNEGDEIPAGFSCHFPEGRRAFIAKTLTSPTEIGGNDIVHVVFSIYTNDKKGVFCSWESMQLVRHVGKNNRGSVEDFADLPDTEDEAQADNEVENSF